MHSCTQNSQSESEFCGIENTPCDLRLRQTCATCTIHNFGAGAPDLTSSAVRFFWNKIE